MTKISKEIQKTEDAQPAPSQDKHLTVSLDELAVILAKHFKLKKGKHQVGFGFKIGVGAVSHQPPTSDKPEGRVLPGAIIAIDVVNLAQVADDFQGTGVVDLSAKKA